MKRRSILISSSIFLLSLVVTVGCNNSPTSQPKATVSPQPGDVKLGFSAWPGWFPWQVAQEKEIFGRSKVGVNLKWFDSYVDSITALNNGSIDANSQTLADTISSIASGNDLVVVLTNDNSTGNDKIIISEQIKSVKDLKGKKVAAEEGTVDHFLLVQALKRVNMTMKDIQFVPLETSKAADAFVAGQVDAAAVFAPFTTKALKRPGSRELFSSKDFPGSISDHLVFTRKFVKEHPDKVQAVVDSWFATLGHINRGLYRDEADQIMAKRAGVSMAEYKDYLDGTKIFSLEDNLEAFKPGTDTTSLPRAAAEANKFLFENKLIKTQVDVSKIFDDRFVKAYAAKTRGK
ncbi:ABC transporter substrate-binding protein [Chamaesiphon minutus]|uniref:ABC transporter, substrate-binding protein, aliphatic sulfonates family n=1 Tax=Chamaesiphon minutus (strain ATCC 27169 / PCC 6605) TaxID=1173020 RepID=K9UNN6_CHAP6|nr:ABC transporter substrate-binding protein [Chamaesiphon minutus]AFY96440.1 ABC transporter, substrate-binding protein, aliphatic sulfonates family [Chamaesiphon minutus PCC 6605]